MSLYQLDPEVCGGHGSKTIYGETNEVEEYGISAKVKYLHYEFDGWLGDSLIESTPCFIVLDSLKQILSELFKNDLSFEECLITTSEEFREMYHDITLPNFIRIIPRGKVKLERGKYTEWSGHNFCLSQKGELVVTSDALTALKQFQLSFCDVTEIIE